MMASFVTWLAQLSECQRHREVVEYTVTSTMSMRMPAARTLASRTWLLWEQVRRGEDDSE